MLCLFVPLSRVLSTFKRCLVDVRLILLCIALLVFKLGFTIRKVHFVFRSSGLSSVPTS